MNIFEKITNLSTLPSQESFLILENELINFLSKELLPEFVRKTKPKDQIEFLANQELLLIKSKEVLNTYIFSTQKWKSKLNFDKYLFKSLHNYIFNINVKNKNIIFKNKFICPGCKFFNFKNKLEINNNQFSCKICFENLNNKSLPINNKLIYKTFSCHSKTGGKCPNCFKWIPESNFSNFIGFCPFCDFNGEFSKLIPATHPQSLFMMSNFEEFDVNKNAHNKISEDFSPETSILSKEKFLNDFKLLIKVLEDQNFALANKSRNNTLAQKHLMYKAFYNSVYKYPVQMIDYLIYQKITDGFNIQAKIFQEYCQLIENYLPMTILKNNEKSVITDYCDPNLNLYLGISEFQSIIEENFNIKNKTNEVYIGGKKLINYGPCFIGKLISVSDDHQNNLTNLVDNYSFNNIKLKPNDIVVPGDIVTIKHFRIASHYEMGPLVFLQRIRKDITIRTRKIVHGK